MGSALDAIKDKLVHPMDTFKQPFQAVGTLTSAISDKAKKDSAWAQQHGGIAGKVFANDPIVRGAQGKPLDPLSGYIAGDKQASRFGNTPDQPVPQIQAVGEQQYTPLAVGQQSTDPNAVQRNAFTTQLELDNQKALQALRMSKDGQ